MSSKLQIQRYTFRDSNNVLCSSWGVVINGQLCRPKKNLGFVWGPKEWVNLETRISRKELVFEYQGQPFRVMTKVAIPLKLAEGEVLHPMEFQGNASFIKE